MVAAWNGADHYIFFSFGCLAYCTPNRTEHIWACVNPKPKPKTGFGLQKPKIRFPTKAPGFAMSTEGNSNVTLDVDRVH